MDVVFQHSSKSLLIVFNEREKRNKYSFGTTWKQVKSEQMKFFVWTNPLSMSFDFNFVRNKILLLVHITHKSVNNFHGRRISSFTSSMSKKIFWDAPCHAWTINESRSFRVIPFRMQNDTATLLNTKHDEQSYSSAHLWEAIHQTRSSDKEQQCFIKPNTEPPLMSRKKFPRIHM